jgi:predicted HicB family RNase H-like nuclease
MNPHAYSITVRQVHDEDGACFEARVRELPDVAEYGDTVEEAYELAIDTIETVAAALAEQGKPMPSPHEPNDEYSGRITVRVPKSLHRDLAEAAETDGVSLNQLISGALATYIGVRGAGASVDRFFESGGSTL